jgi:hypothetical protein
MRSVPQEMLVTLIFGTVLLLQFLYKHLRRKVAAMQAQVEPQVSAEAAPLPRTAEPAAAQAPAAGLPVPVRAPRSAPRITAALALPRSWPRHRRLSRQSLMPDRRAVQHAIVTAAILRPCHAHRPHDVDQSAPWASPHPFEEKP